VAPIARLDAQNGASGEAAFAEEGGRGGVVGVEKSAEEAEGLGARGEEE